MRAPLVRWVQFKRAHQTLGLWPFQEQPCSVNTAQKAGQSSQLCSLLTGHTNLQGHKCKLKLTFTPTCSCLKEDETVDHFFFICEKHRFLRQRLNLDVTNYAHILLAYIEGRQWQIYRGPYLPNCKMPGRIGYLYTAFVKCQAEQGTYTQHL